MNTCLVTESILGQTSRRKKSTWPLPITDEAVPKGGCSLPTEGYDTLEFVPKIEHLEPNKKPSARPELSGQKNEETRGFV